MTFDASIAAQRALQRTQDSGALGERAEQVFEAEQRFSEHVGDDATSAYRALLDLGGMYADVESFQAFLIYITWQQLVEETTAEHAHTGLILCDEYLIRWSDGAEATHIVELRRSFNAVLGQDDTEEEDYDEDVFKGGD